MNHLRLSLLTSYSAHTTLFLLALYLEIPTMLRPSPLGWRYACGGFRNVTGGVGGNFVVLG